MRLHEILGMIERHFYLGIIGIIVLGIIASIGYFIIYKKCLGGKGKFTKKQIFVWTLLAGYIIMVIGVTLLSRGSYYEGNINMNFLSTYREAWNSFRIRNWQLIILNIAMFVPLGILLPLLHNHFHKIRWALGAGFIFTLCIECLQLITGRGIFDFDDLFNNVLGVIIGYSIVMGILILVKEQKHKISKIVGYLSPLLLVGAVFTGMFCYYNLQEFGNLSTAYDYKINMKNIKITLNSDLSNERTLVPIYQAPTYNKDSAREFAINFFENINIDMKDSRLDAYNDSATFWAGENPSYNIGVEYLDGSYRFTDLSCFNEGLRPMNVEQDVVVESLNQLGISLPKEALFNILDIGTYEWIVKKNSNGDYLTDGNLFCSYYNDGTIKKVENNLVTYNKIKAISIKSEKEAYEELIGGKFKYYPVENGIGTIDILGIELDYQLDSKGFYQPVYVFHCVVNEMEARIIIPALLK